MERAEVDLLAWRDEMAVPVEAWLDDFDWDALEGGQVSGSAALGTAEGRSARLVRYMLNRERPLWPGYRFEDYPYDWPTGQTLMERAEALCRNEYLLPDDSRIDLSLPFADSGVLGAPCFARHCWVHDLAEAYRRTGQERFARAFERLVTRWLEEFPLRVREDFSRNDHAGFSPPAYGGLAACYQLLEAMDAIAGPLRKSPSISVDFWVRYLKHTWFLALQYHRYADDDYRKDNHFLMERGTVPLLVGIFFGEFRSLRPLAERGRAVLERQLADVVLPDGCCQEHSVYYSFRVLVRFMLAILVAEANGVELNWRAHRERLRRLVIFHRHCVRPDGLNVAIGDGAACPVHPEQSRHEQFFEIAESDWSSGNLHVYPEGGYVFMRSGWDRDANFLAVSVPNRCVSNIHLHHDVMSFNLASYGESLIEEPSSRLYGRVRGVRRLRDWRRYLYGSETHNVLQVDGNHGADPGWFDSKAVWGGNGLRGVIQACDSGSGWAAATLYEANFWPVLHRRHVIMLSDWGFLFVDELMPDVEGTVNLASDIAPRDYCQRLHADVGVRIVRAGQGRLAMLGRRRGLAVFVHGPALQELRCEVYRERALGRMVGAELYAAKVNAVKSGPCLLLQWYLCCPQADDTLRLARRAEAKVEFRPDRQEWFATVSAGDLTAEACGPWSGRTLGRCAFERSGYAGSIRVRWQGFDGAAKEIRYAWQSCLLE